MPTTRYPNRRATLAATLLATLIGSGCAAPVARDVDVAAEIPLADLAYTVKRGDRLGDIARELTGDMARWKEIAASNGIEDPRSLRVGAVLRIPGALLPAPVDAPADDLAVASAELDPEPAVTVVSRRALPAIAPGLAVRQRTPVRLSPVDINRRFTLSPLDAKTPAEATDDRGAGAVPPQAAPPDAGRSRTPSSGAEPSGTERFAASVEAAAPRQVKVIGSYFPKGVYAQPAVYSKLLMRVAPGTLFELDRKVGDWYGVVTENGIGYLRDADARVLGGDADERRAAATLGTVRG